MFVFLVWAFVAEQQNWPQRQPLAAKHCDAKKKKKKMFGLHKWLTIKMVIGAIGIEDSKIALLCSLLA